MTTQTEYNATSYRTPALATRAAVVDWATACGTESEEDAAEMIASDTRWYAEELADLVRKGDWTIPNVDDADDVDVAEELLLDFVTEHVDLDSLG